MKTKDKIASTGSKNKWSARITENSHALDLKPHVFSSSSPKKIAQSLKTSAEHSDHKKGNAYQSAMSMLNFYVNRAGKNLSADKKNTLRRAKAALKELFHKPAGKSLHKRS